MDEFAIHHDRQVTERSMSRISCFDMMIPPKSVFCTPKCSSTYAVRYCPDLPDTRLSRRIEVCLLDKLPQQHALRMRSPAVEFDHALDDPQAG